MILRFLVILATLITFVLCQKPSPCPEVFNFEPRGSEEDRWYGVISLTTEEELNGVWIQLGLDRPAELLGNWFADAISRDNIKFIIRNPNYVLEPNRSPLTLRFFVKYNTAQPIPSIDYIRLNGRTICSAQNPSVSTTTEKLHISQLVGNQTSSSSSSSSNNNNPTRRPSQPVSSNSGGTSSFINNNQNNQGATQLQNQGNSGSNALSTGGDSSNGSDFFPGDFAVPTKPNSRPQTQNKNVKCGEVGVQAARPLISFGQDTIPGQWPWHAALYHHEGVHSSYTCGGTLISERHVLTAAHCVAKPQTSRPIPTDSIVVYLGKHSLKIFDDKIQNREIDQIFIHPEYNATVYFNDIAILKLSSPVVITKYVRTCCLWEGNTELETIINQLGTVVGWGFDENRKLHDNLLQAKMPVVSPLKCIYSNREFFSQFTFENNFCAGFSNGTSVCNGDSGGGLVFPKPGSSAQNPVWQLRGLVSVGVALQGLGSCDTTNYAIFTDVAKYTSWIRDIIKR